MRRAAIETRACNLPRRFANGFKSAVVLDTLSRMGRFARIADGRECWDGPQHVPRHRHDQAYVAIVLAGGYEECGSRGRFRAGPGDVLVHGTFDAHLNRFGRGGAVLFNLRVDMPVGTGVGRVEDPEAIARTGERDPVEARAQLREQLREMSPAPPDWPDMLAQDLLRDSTCRLQHWAREHGLAAETVSRGFAKVFGVTPVAFRAEARAHRAFAHIMRGDAPLVSVAAETGFADQAHLSRATRALTGLPPGAWRRSKRFKTTGASPR